MTRRAGGLIDVADLPVDTGWLTLTMNTNYSSSNAEYRRIGDVVYVSGNISYSGANADWGTAFNTIHGAVCTLPIPPLKASVIIAMGSNAAADHRFRLALTTDGNLAVRPMSASISKATSIYLNELIYLAG